MSGSLPKLERIMKTSGNTILLTGGSSGMGRALAQRLHDLGNEVIVAGRRQDALDETIAGRDRMHAKTVDVEHAQDLRRFAREVVERHPNLNVLINNAGIMRYEDATAKRDLADAEATVVTNLLGPIRLIDALVDHLSGKPDAAIVNVTSGLAFVPLPKAPTYSATKAAIHSYTQALRMQLKGKIQVIELAPPGVQTDLTPGQSTREGYMPLQEFADEVIALFKADPDAPEILVERVKNQRFAEREGRTDEVLARLATL
jgi:uncharacterized oxidoreductase